MRHRRWWKSTKSTKSITSIRSIVVVTVAAAVASSSVGIAAAHPNVDPEPVVSPDAARSTSGDYATDVLSDPWDFSNDEDVPPIPMIGSENSQGIVRNADGTLTVASVNNSTVKLVRTWGVELPWGRDGLSRPSMPTDTPTCRSRCVSTHRCTWRSTTGTPPAARDCCRSTRPPDVVCTTSICATPAPTHPGTAHRGAAR